MTNKATAGIALVTVLLIMAVVTVLAFGTVFTTQVELRITRNDATFTQANYAAQTGLEKYKTALFQNFRYLRNQSSVSSDAGSCINQFDAGLDIDRDGTVEPWGADNRIVFGPETVYQANGTTPAGSYTVTIYADSSVDNYYTIRSIGESNGAQATVESVLEISNGGTLANAVFAGIGGGNSKFNGGATVRGGVYVYGEGDEFDEDTTTPDEDNPVFNTTGNFAVYNDYDLSRTQTYGDAQNHVADPSDAQLCANFRIADGQVDLGSSAVSLGSSTNPLLGVYVDDGVDDILVKNNTDVTDSCKQNGGVCANSIGAFDFDEAPELPRLGEDSGATLVDDDACTADPEYWESCIREDAQGGSLTVIGGVYEGLTVNECLANYVVDGELVFGGQNISCIGTTLAGESYGIAYTEGSTDVFRLYGDVLIDGLDVRFSEPVEYQMHGYEEGASGLPVPTEKASLSVLSDGTGAGGDVLFDATFLTDEAYGVWPEQVFAVIAENEVRQRGDHLMAQVYAGYRFRTEGQNVLYGQVITDEFCTTSAGQDECIAGQSAEIVYLDPMGNSPRHFQNINPMGGGPTFRVLSYNLR